MNRRCTTDTPAYKPLPDRGDLRCSPTTALYGKLNAGHCEGERRASRELALLRASNVEHDVVARKSLPRHSGKQLRSRVVRRGAGRHRLTKLLQVEKALAMALIHPATRCKIG